MSYSMQVFSSCDGEYFDRCAESMLASVDINSPGQRVVLHVFDPGEGFEHRLDAIRKRLRSTCLEVMTDRTGGSRVAPEDKAGFPAARCFRALADHFRASRLDTLFVDINSLVVRDLYAFPNAFPEADLAIHCGAGPVAETGPVRPGVVWLRATAVTCNFLDRVTRRMNTGRYNDHAALLDVLEGMPQLRAQPLSSRFIDWECTDQGVIWSAQSEPGIANRTYQKKASSILDEFRASKTIAILSLRADLGGKAGFLTKRRVMRRRLRNPVDLHWQYFPKIVRDVLNEKVCRAEIICKPLWEIDQAFVQRLPHETVFVPHRNRRQISDPRAVFYMAELYPFFFTVDVNGWAASSSLYASGAYRQINETHRAEAFVENARSQRLTKYPQSEGRYRDFDVFFPLQVPGDEALRFHSDHRLKDIVHAVINWAERYDRQVLFKRHPQNPDIEYLELHQRQLRNCRFVAKGNVHELLDQAKVVFVANSGVGFEALIHFKPLVVFARAIYDVVALRGTLDVDGIEKAYQKALAQRDPRENYLKFVEWYLFHAGVLINQPSVDVNLSLVHRAGFPNRYHGELAGLLQGGQADSSSCTERGLSARLVSALHGLARWPRERLQELVELASPQVLQAAYFRDKHVALVGNDEGILQRSFGKQIDAHDVVVRMDLSHPLALRKGAIMDEATREQWLAGVFEDRRVKPAEAREVLRADTPWEVKERYTDIRHFGEKTTVWSFSTLDRKKQRFYSGQFIHALRVWMRPSLYRMQYRLWPNSRRIPCEYQAYLRERLSIEPSSSLIFFEMLRRSAVAGLDLYGFDFASNGGIAPNNRTDYLAHALNAEFEYVHGQVAKTPGFRLNGFRYNRIPIGYHAGRRVALLGFHGAEAKRFRELFPGSQVVKEFFRFGKEDFNALDGLDSFVWSRLDPESEALISGHGIDVTRVSDGLVENAWCFDKAGLYSEPTTRSELLYMLRHLHITPELAELSDSIFNNLGYPAELPCPRQANRVLLITERDNGDQLAELAERENPGMIVTSVESVLDDVDVLHPIGRQQDIFAGVARVYTRAAPLAVVAVLRGIPTTVLGEPIYAGWGLTDDRASVRREPGKLSRQRLFTAVVLLYPRYFSPGKGFDLPPELRLE